MPGLILDEEMKPFSDALRESISKVHRTANNREFIK
jgi:hypothetical protein